MFYSLRVSNRIKRAFHASRLPTAVSRDYARFVDLLVHIVRAQAPDLVAQPDNAYRRPRHGHKGQDDPQDEGNDQPDEAAFQTAGRASSGACRGHARRFTFTHSFLL